MKVSKMAIVTVLCAAAGSASAQGPSGADQVEAVGAMRSIHTAEAYYASHNKQEGYACTLDRLSEKDARHPALLVSALREGKVFHGYVFHVSCPDGQEPAQHYAVTAIPQEETSKAFCSDEGGVIRWTEAAEAAKCSTSGKPLDTLRTSSK